MKVTTFLAAWYSLLLFVSGQVLAITWDFNKQADVKDWEGPDAQRKTCKWTMDLKEGVFQAIGLADEGTAFVKKTAWKDDWLDYTLEVKSEIWERRTISVSVSGRIGLDITMDSI